MGKKRKWMVWRIIAYLLILLVLPLVVIGWFVSQPGWGRNQPTQAHVDPGVLRKHVDVLARQFAPRSYEDRTHLAECANYIRSEFQRSGAVVSNQVYVFNKQAYVNVVAVFPGRDNRRIIVGAHYDTCGRQPGADDNASGVAGLLELAQLLGRADLPLTVELVAYCTEEPPFFSTSAMGSARHAKKLRAQRIPVQAVIVLEMIGCFSDERGSQHFPLAALRLFYPSRGNFIAIVGSSEAPQRALIRAVKRGMRGSTDLAVYSISAPRVVPGVDFSDHRNYWDIGLPAVMITDTAFYRNPMCHRTGDTPERLDYGRMAKVVEALYETVVAGDRLRSAD
jgi:Zn-dependent M28 family amino/carboxypeptidase